MWIDVLARPMVMVCVHLLLLLALSAIVYGFARTAEYAITHRGEAKDTGGTWSVMADGVLAILMASGAWLGVMVLAGTLLAHWLSMV